MSFLLPPPIQHRGKTVSFKNGNCLQYNKKRTSFFRRQGKCDNKICAMFL